MREKKQGALLSQGYYREASSWDMLPLGEAAFVTLAPHCVRYSAGVSMTRVIDTGAITSHCLMRLIRVKLF
jgi:hypothetical protein